MTAVMLILLDLQKRRIKVLLYGSVHSFTQLFAFFPVLSLIIKCITLSSLLEFYLIITTKGLTYGIIKLDNFVMRQVA